MKNLKKVLAFALVVCMMLSTIVSATAISATDYTDYSTIKNADQVAVLTELGVINGYPDESFKPEKTVSRAEMAKMITVILNKGTEAAGNYDGAQVFSDVYADMWCKGYINYCNTLGIVVGMGDGTYKPNQGVTVVQTAKMLLVAMGYDPVVEGFEGANWEVNVSAIAAQAGLYNGVTANAAAECSRDTAALIIYNALVANTVDGYTNGKAVVGDKTMLGKYFNAVVVTGVVVANDYANLFGDSALYNAKHASTELALIGTQYVDDDDPIDPGVSFLSNGIQIDAAFPFEFTKSFYDEYGNNDNYASQIFETATTLEQVGQTVKVVAQLKDNYDLYYKNVTSYPNFTFSGKVIGKVMDVDCVVKEYDGEYALLDKTSLKKEGIVIDDTTRYFVNYSVAWEQFGSPSRYSGIEGKYSSYTALGFYNPSLISTLTNKAYSVDGIFFNADGAYTKIVDVDGDGVAEMVLQWRPFFAEVEYDDYLKEYTFDYNFVDDDEAGLVLDDLLYYNGATKLYGDFLPNYDAVDPDDIICEDDIDDGDKVLVVPVDGKFYVELCESKTVTVDTVSIDADKKDYVKADGTTYYESGLYWAYKTYDLSGDGPDHNELYWNLSDCDTDTDYALYFDSYGNVVAYKEDKGPKGSGKYALVTQSYIKDNGVKDPNYYLELTKGGTSKTSYVEVQWEGKRFTKVDPDALPFFVEARPTSVITYLPFQKENWVYDTGRAISTGLLTGENAFYVDYPGSFWADTESGGYAYAYGRLGVYGWFNNPDDNGGYSYGYYTALIRTSYDDSDGTEYVDVKALDELCDFNGSDNYSVTAKKNYFYSAANGKTYAATDDTVFFIYQYDDETGALVDVYSFVGYKNLSAIPFGFTPGTGATCTACDEANPYGTHTCDGDWHATGISAMYGEIEGGGPNAGSINALVIETNTVYTRVSTDYVFVYNVQYTTTTGGDLRWYVDYIDADGKTDSMYVDYEHSSDFGTSKTNVKYGVYNRSLCSAWDDDDTYDLSSTNYNFKNALLEVTEAPYIGAYIVFNDDYGDPYYTDANTLYFFNCAVESNRTDVSDQKLAPTTKAALLDKGKDGKAKVSSYYVIWKYVDGEKVAVAIIGGYINPIVYNSTDNVYAERYSTAAGAKYKEVYDFSENHWDANGDVDVANGHTDDTDSCEFNECWHYVRTVRTTDGFLKMLDDDTYGKTYKGSYGYFCNLVKGSSGQPDNMAGTDGPPPAA